MTKKIWFLAFLVLGSFIITTSLSNSSGKLINNTSPNQNINQELPIVIGYSNWVGWWPWAIAESKGLFNKHGVNVELRWYDDYSKSLEDLAAGVIDGNSQTLNDTISFAAKSSKGEVVVLVNDNSAGNDKIIAAKGIDTIEDLRNKQVLVEEGVVDDFLLTLALEKAGMSRNDVQIIDLETGAATAAFAAGEGDAVGAFPPFWLEAFKRPGSTKISSSKDFPGAIPDLLVVTEELVKEKPQQVQALIDVWFDILKFMSSAPVEADEIMAAKAKISDLQIFKEGVKMFNLTDNLEAFSEGNSMKNMPYASRKIVSFLHKYFKNFKDVPDLDNIFEQSFIEAHAKNVN